MMTHPVRWPVLIGMTMALAAAAHAETMRCQYVGGNVNCASPSGASCQTINGQTRCVSGGGGIVQSFHDRSSGQSVPAEEPDDADPGTSDAR
jgi:hypothetical protein